MNTPRTTPRTRDPGRTAGRLLGVCLLATIALSLAACGGGSNWPSSGSRSSGGSGGSGGSGSGGSGFGGGLAAFHGLTGPDKATNWIAFDSLPGLKLRVRTSASTAGRYVLDMRNDYVERIYVGWNLAPYEIDDTDRRSGIAAGSSYSSSFSLAGYYQVVYVYIGKIRFGEDSGPYYKPGIEDAGGVVARLDDADAATLETLAARDPLAFAEPTDPVAREALAERRQREQQDDAMDESAR